MKFKYFKKINDQHIHPTKNIELSPFKDFIATSGISGNINIYKSPDFELSTTEQLHQGAIEKIKWGPFQLGHYLATSGYDGKVTVLKLVENQIITLFETNLNTPVYSIDWCEHGYRPVLIASNAKGEIFSISKGDYNWRSSKIGQFKSSKKPQGSNPLLSNPNPLPELTPTLVSIGKTSNQNVFRLAVSLNNQLCIFDYNINEKECREKSRINIQSQIIDISWEHGLFEDSTLLVVTINKLILLDGYLSKRQEIVIHDSKESKNLSIGWSEDDSTINVYVKGKDGISIQYYSMDSMGRVYTTHTSETKQKPLKPNRPSLKK